MSAELGTGSGEGSEIREIVELVCKKGDRRNKEKKKKKTEEREKISTVYSIVTTVTSKSKSHVDTESYIREQGMRTRYQRAELM